MNYHDDSLDAMPDDNGKKGRDKLHAKSMFPSFRIMFIAVAVALLLMLVCGWKIVSLDVERNRLRLDKASLEQETKNLQEKISLHSKLLRELPELGSRELELRSTIADSEGKVRDLANRQATLAQKVGAQQETLESAVAGRIQAEAAAKAAREEAGRLQSAISASRSDKSALDLETAGLRQKVDGMKSESSNLAARAQSLKAEIASLEKTKETRIAELESLSRDNQKLLEVSSRLEDFVADMEKTGKMANEAAESLERTGSEANQAVAGLATESKASNEAVKGLNTSIASLAGLLEEIRKDRADMKTAVVDLTDAGSEAKKQGQRLAVQLDDPVGKLKSNTDALEKNLLILDADVKKIKSSHEDLERGTQKLANLGTQLDSLQTRMTTNVQKFENDNKEIGKSSVALDDQVRAAVQALQRFTTMIDSISSSESGADTSETDIKKTVTGLKTTLAEVSQTLEEVRNLSKGASSAFLENKETLETVIDQVVRDAEELQKEIRAQLETVRKKINQPELPAADSGKAS